MYIVIFCNFQGSASIPLSYWRKIWTADFHRLLFAIDRNRTVHFKNLPTKLSGLLASRCRCVHRGVVLMKYISRCWPKLPSHGLIANSTGYSWEFGCRRIVRCGWFHANSTKHATKPSPSSILTSKPAHYLMTVCRWRLLLLIHFSILVSIRLINASMSTRFLLVSSCDTYKLRISVYPKWLEVVFVEGLAPGRSRQCFNVGQSQPFPLLYRHFG